MAEKRARNWSFVIWEESYNNLYVSILDELHICWCESPWHDSDIEADGKKKKVHKHILVCFDGLKSYEQIKDISDSVNASFPVKIQSVRGMVRYFIHLDSPDKHQYDRSGIITHGGLNIDDYFLPSEDEVKKLVSDMIIWIDDNDITEIKDFNAYCIKFHYSDWWDIYTRFYRVPAIINSHLSSKRNFLKEKLKNE